MVYHPPLGKNSYLIEYRFYHNTISGKTQWIYFKIARAHSARQVINRFWGPQYRVKRICLNEEVKLVVQEDLKVEDICEDTED